MNTCMHVQTYALATVHNTAMNNYCPTQVDAQNNGWQSAVFCSNLSYDRPILAMVGSYCLACAIVT